MRLFLLTLTVLGLFTVLFARGQHDRDPTAAANTPDDGPVAQIKSLGLFKLDEQGLVLSVCGPAGDEDLVHLKRLAHPEELLLTGSWVTDRGLKNVRGLTTLRVLCLNNTDVTDAGLAELMKLTDLESLNLDGTQITDGGLLHLEQLVNIEILSLENTEITDEGLAYLKKLPNLKILSLAWTQVSDAGLAYLKDLKGLCELDLRGTQLSPKAGKSLQKALPRCLVVVPSNDFSESAIIAKVAARGL